MYFLLVSQPQRSVGKHQIILYNITLIVISLQLALKTVNTARSAFACFLFERKFFHLYRDSSGGRGTQRGSGSEDEENSFKCKISTRVSMKILYYSVAFVLP